MLDELLSEYGVAKIGFALFVIIIAAYMIGVVLPIGWK